VALFLTVFHHPVRRGTGIGEVRKAQTAKYYFAQFSETGDQAHRLILITAVPADVVRRARFRHCARQDRSQWRPHDAHAVA
jgi:hypothetical protein